MHVGEFDGSGVAAGLVGGEPDDDHLRRVARKRLAPERHAVLLIRHAVDTLREVEFAGVPGRALIVARQVDEEVAKRLVGAHDLGVPGPQADVVELNAFAGNAAEEHGADAAVADRQRFLLPAGGRVGRGLIVTQSQIRRRGGRRSSRRRCGRRRTRGTELGHHLHRHGDGGAVAHPDGRALVGKSHLRRDVLPCFQIAGTQRAVTLLRVGVKIDDIVVADSERGRSLDPEALRRDRFRKVGERPLQVGGLRHLQVLFRLRGLPFILDDQSQPVPGAEEGGVDHAEAGIVEQLRRRQVREILRRGGLTIHQRRKSKRAMTLSEKV